VIRLPLPSQLRHKLNFLTVSNKSCVVIDLNVGHSNSLWPADEHSAHAD